MGGKATFCSLLTLHKNHQAALVKATLETINNSDKHSNMSDELPSSGRPRTREQQQAAKKRGDIRGFSALPQGRHPKPTKAAKRKSNDEKQPVGLLEDTKPAAKKTSRISYHDYNEPVTKA